MMTVIDSFGCFQFLARCNLALGLHGNENFFIIARGLGSLPFNAGCFLRPESEVPTSNMLNAIGRLLSFRFFEHPILVVGTGRSGTSVLLQALGKHPQIYALPGEAPFITSIGGSAYLFEHAENRNYYLESLKVDKDYLYDQLRRLGFEVAAGPYYGVKRMVRGLLGAADAPLGRRHWCAKSFPSEKVTEGLLTLYPDIRFVYIVRNGCDVVQSRTKFKGFTHQTFRQHCLAWAEAVDKYRHLGELPQCFKATQEALLANPAQFFTQLFAHLEIPQHSGPADYAATTLVHPLDQSTRTNTGAREAIAARELPYAGWTEEQKRLFKDICTRPMRELGYELPF